MIYLLFTVPETIKNIYIRESGTSENIFNFVYQACPKTQQFQSYIYFPEKFLHFYTDVQQHSLQRCLSYNKNMIFIKW